MTVTLDDVARNLQFRLDGTHYVEYGSVQLEVLLQGHVPNLG
ncbi:hypothetical protein [Dactylosporangium sp. CA-092794]